MVFILKEALIIVIHGSSVVSYNFPKIEEFPLQRL